MLLTAGARLGPYEIVSPLGSGGMGEVYKARDTRLDRTVAIKILPADVAEDPRRRERFRREARAISSLTHPYICTVHDVGEHDGIVFLVMEFLAGETLAHRLLRGALPLEDVLRIAAQIAEALDAAHGQGLIHRDLKPANVMLTANGTKVLDFGLAKWQADESDAAISVAQANAPPTLTQVGSIIGTAHYMAPEQVEGKPVDARSDLFALGAIVYEMTTGRQAFEGTTTSVMAAILTATPPAMATLQPLTPSTMDRVVKKCLAKDPTKRWRTAADLRDELAWIGEDVGAHREAAPSSSPAGGTAHRRFRAATLLGWYLPWTLAAGGVLTAAVMVTLPSLRRDGPDVGQLRILRLQVTPPGAEALSLNDISRSVAISPDGSRLVYVGANGTTLFVRPLDSLEATPLVHGLAIRHPFVSPDGQWVGFFDGPVTLKKAPIAGGPVALVARLDNREEGATWAADGTIIFATNATTTGLRRVSADGGEPSVLTRPDPARSEVNHTWPELLPGSQAVLFTVTATTGHDADSIVVLDLRTGGTTMLLRGGRHAQYAASGHLVYAAAGTLRAVRFDPARLIVVGASRPVVPEVLTTPAGAVEAVLARNGTLVYVAGAAGSGTARTLVWVDRQGRETPLAAPPRAYYYPRISPDGTRVALQIVDYHADIWLWDFARATLTRVTADPATDANNPVWTPDGRRLVFSSRRAGSVPNVFIQVAGGTGLPERLTKSPISHGPTAASPDGTWVVFNEVSPTTGMDLMAVRLDGTHQVLPLARTPFNERNGIVSPNGRWLAYEADDSGPFEIYVRSFPDTTRERWHVSTNGGMQPLWARRGQELFYFAPDGALMRVAVGRGSAWTAGAPTRVLEGRYVVSTSGNVPRNYDIAADGQRFLMVKAGGSDTIGTPQIVVVEHFDEELKRLVPAK